MSSQQTAKVLRERGNINPDGTVTGARRGGGQRGRAGSRSTPASSFGGTKIPSVASVAVSTENVPDSAKKNQLYFYCDRNTVRALSNTSIEPEGAQNGLIGCSNLNLRETKTDDTSTRVIGPVYRAQQSLTKNKKWYVGLITNDDEWAALSKNGAFWPPLAGQDNATVFTSRKAYQQSLVEGESSTQNSEGRLVGAGAGAQSGDRTHTCDLVVHLGDKISVYSTNNINSYHTKAFIHTCL